MDFRSFQFCVFDTRLQNQPQKMPIERSIVSAENVLSDFITDLNPSHFQNTSSGYPETSQFSPSLQIPKITSKDYLLVCLKIDTYGFHYQIFEPVFLQPVAYCIVQKSTMVFPITDDLLNEIKNAFTKSFQDGFCYAIEEIGVTSSFETTEENFTNDLVKNVSFLGKALNITKLDPVNLVGSFGSINAIDYSFNEETAIPSPDGRLGLPPGTKIEPKFYADVNIFISIFEEKTSFSEKFSETVSINIPFPPATEFSESNSKEILVQKKQLFPSYNPKLVEIVKKYKRSAKILINKINFSNIWRNQAKSQILTEGEVRLDLQGLDKSKFNYQLQVGPHTIAAVLIDRTVAEIRLEAERTYAIRKIKSGFQQSLDDCHIYHVSFKSTQLSLGNQNDDPVSDPEESDPMSQEEGKEAAKDSAFSASFTYEFVKQNTKESKNTVTHSRATRSLYALKQNIAYDTALLRLDDEFRFWIEKQLHPEKPETLQRFIDEVGTHYTTSVTYGGVGFQVLKLSYEAVQELNEKKISISTAAADSLLSQSSTSETKKAYSSYDSKTEAQTVFLGGTVMPQIDPENQRLDFKEWSESVPNQPIPLEIKISCITDLLNPTFFPKMDPSLLKQLKLSLSNAIFEYLKKNSPKEDTTEHQVFTSSFSSWSSKFTLEALNSPKTVSDPYLDYWSTLPYMFPCLKENSGADPLVFFFRLGDPCACEKIVHNTAYTLGCVKLKEGYHGPEFVGYDSLSFFQGWPQAYFDSPSHTERAFWIIEKLNTSGDLIIRDGDQIRLKHVGSGEYLATTSLNDAHQTLTRTTDKNDAVFVIKKA